MTLLSAEVYEALVESLEIVADEHAFAKRHRASERYGAARMGGER